MWANLNFTLADIPLFPPVASEQAPGIDALYFFLTAVSVVMTVLIFAAVIFFAYKYRSTRAPARDAD